MTLPLTNAVHAGGRELNLLVLQRGPGTRGRAEEEAPGGLNSRGLSVRNYNPHGIIVFNVTPVLMPVPYLPTPSTSSLTELAGRNGGTPGGFKIVQ